MTVDNYSFTTKADLTKNNYLEGIFLDDNEIQDIKYFIPNKDNYVYFDGQLERSRSKLNNLFKFNMFILDINQPFKY